MSAPAATARWAPPQLPVFRDDGPLARALARPGRSLPVPAVALAAAGLVPLVAAVAVTGAGASNGLVAGVITWAVLCGCLSTGRPQAGRLAWLIVPLLRVAEYTAIVWVAAIAGGAAPPAAFALLAATAYRQYDLVYRLRHQGTTPREWVGDAAGGWDGRMLYAAILLIGDGVVVGYYVAAVLMAALFVAESIHSWRTAAARVGAPAFQDDQEDEDA